MIIIIYFSDLLIMVLLKTEVTNDSVNCCHYSVSNFAKSGGACEMKNTIRQKKKELVVTKQVKKNLA